MDSAGDSEWVSGLKIFKLRIDFRKRKWYTSEVQMFTYRKHGDENQYTPVTFPSESCRLVQGSENRGVEFLSEWLP